MSGGADIISLVPEGLFYTKLHVSGTETPLIKLHFILPGLTQRTILFQLYIQLNNDCHRLIDKQYLKLPGRQSSFNP